MSAANRVLLLVGSPRGPRSASESIGGYLADRLAAGGMAIERVRIGAQMPDEAALAAIRAAWARAGVVVLAAPLYVDCVPAQVIRVMEHLAVQPKDPAAAGPRLVAVVNCGFPEAAQNDTALAIYRRFAAEVGCEWAGGFAIGMGGAMGRDGLDKAGWPARHVRRAMALAATALAEGRAVPDEAVRLARKKPLPRWLYLWLGTRFFRRAARENGVASRLADRPYDPRAEADAPSAPAG